MVLNLILKIFFKKMEINIKKKILNMPGKRKSIEHETLDNASQIIENIPTRKSRRTTKDFVEGMLTTLKDNGWKMSLTKITQKNDILYPLSTCNMSVCSRNWNSETNSLFFSIFNNNIWELIKEGTNEMLQKKFSKVTKASKKHFKNATTDEIKHWYLTFTLCELKKKPSLTESFNFLRKNGLTPLSKHRFFAIQGCVSLNDSKIRELCDLLGESFKNHWNSGKKIVLDETIFSYEPKKEARLKAAENMDPIPVIYIPRKPHSTGLLRFFFF